MTNPPETSQAPVGYLQLIRQNPNFRNLWLGEVVSFFGDWFNLIASASLVASLTQSGLAVGGLFVIRMLAPFLISPFAGVAADRFNRKWLLITADLLRAVVVLGFLLVRQPQQVWLLYTLTAIQLAISGFFTPARDAILPDITQSNELGTANILSAATWSVMLAIGAAMGGVVAGVWGIYPAFVIDSVTFLVSAALIVGIRYNRPPDLTAAVPVGKWIGEFNRVYLDGLRHLGKNPDTLVVALQKGAVALTVGGAFDVLQVAVTQKIFVIGQGGSTGLGWMYAVAGIGTGFGPIIARRLTGDRPGPQRLALAIAYGLNALGLLICAPMASFEWLIFGTLIHAAGGGINWVFSTQLLFGLAPNQLRGRVFATEFALFTLGSAAGSYIGGWALDTAGLSLSAIMFWMAGISIIPGLFWVWWLLRKPAQS